MPTFLNRGVEWLLEGGWVQQPANPGLVPGRRRPPPRQRGTPPAPPEEQDSDDQRLDVTLNCDIGLVRSLQLIDEFVDRERWPEVVASLQQVLDGHTGSADSFLKDNEGQWVSLQDHAQRRIRSLPESGLRLYQQVYGPVAEQLLDQGRRTGEMDRLVDVARRYLNTAAGETAALEIATMFIDRGQPFAAVRWYERVSDERLQNASPRMRIEYAEALRQVGRRADAHRQLARVLSDPNLASTDATIARSLSVELRDDAVPERAVPKEQTDWPMVRGNATHSGIARTGHPLLKQKWGVSLSNIPAVEDQLRDVHVDLVDSGRACVPALSAVSEGGLTAVRTLHGVEVYDLASGRLVWGDVGDHASPDRLLSGIIEGDGEQLAARHNVASQARYQDLGDADQHPLASLLYRDFVSGSLSTDGRQLFVVSQLAVLGRAGNNYTFGNQDAARDPFDRDWSTSTIKSYDLATGSVRWEVGGRRTGEPFERPLAGVYFFGPPTVADDELYAVGELENQVLLIVMERLTGRPVWVQPLANAESPIDVDLTRRLWSCAPVVAEGMVFCPTTTGWLVAVDRLERRMVWAYSCHQGAPEKARMRFGGATVVPLQSLNSRWTSSPPMVSGPYLIVAPDELPDAMGAQEPYVACLDRTTGREIWRRPKEDDGLYVAGLTDSAVLVVGAHRFRALSLERGEELWTRTLPVDVKPSGRGLQSGSSYLLPLSSGELWNIDLKDGELRETLRTPSGARPLGSLAVSQEGLLSADHLGLRCFPDRESLQAEIAHRMASDSGDPWSAVRAAEIRYLQGDANAALQRLRTVTEQQLQSSTSGDVVADHQRLLREVLVTVVSEDFQQGEEAYSQLLSSVDHRTDLEIHRLAIERALARKEFAEAWSLLWPPIAGGQADSRLTRGEVTLSVAAWERGRLAELYALSPDEVRSQMDQALAAAAADGSKTIEDRK
ncbi:MAG: PQQ-binding-like beta-propeller repeat protein, partial [Planctomycetaceae bacterium]|nr:PQQ-binding-like beta-propeller repeat protein [Planctomycetaceae bacterium]